MSGHVRRSPFVNSDPRARLNIIDVAAFRQDSVFLSSRMKQAQLVRQEKRALSSACSWGPGRSWGPSSLPWPPDHRTVALTAGPLSPGVNMSVPQRC